MSHRDDLIDMMTAEYRRLASLEPAKDAGNHPSLDVHDRVGAAWAEWDRKIQAVQLVLSSNLLMRHLVEAHRG